MRDLFGEPIAEPVAKPQSKAPAPVMVINDASLLRPRPFRVIRTGRNEVLIWHDTDAEPPPCPSQPKADFLFG